MKLVPSGLGAEPKKLAVLGGLVVVLIVVFFLNRTPDSPGAPTSASVSSSGVNSTRPAPSSPIAVANRAFDSVTPMPPARTRAAQGSSESSIQDFKPTLKPPEGTDVSRIDPTLRLDEIAKLRTMSLEGGSRSIFDFGAAPPPQLPAVAPIKPVTPVAAATTPAAPAAPATPPKPVVPPIPLKYYGYVDGSSGPVRKAFFLLNEDIFVAGENDTVNGHYKILHINANSAIVEDTTSKNQQTLPLVEELPG
jgi:hypothetical protein